MKPTRFLTVVLVLLGLVATASALTPAGTTISNQAVGNYEDANGNAMAEVQSNTVTTTVAQVGGVSVSPATGALTIEPQTVAQYGVTITNGGNGDDTFDLTPVMSGSYTGTYTVEIWKDVDGNGTIDGSDVQLTATAGVYETDQLSMNGTFDIVVRVENTDLAPDGDAPVVTLTAASQFDGTDDDGVYTTTINAAALTVEMSTDNQDPQPGETITYTVCATNGSGASTAHNVVFTDLIPAHTSYVAGTILLGSTSLTDAVDEDGDTFVYPDDADEDEGDFGGTTANTVTVFMGDIAAGEEVCVSFDVLVDSDAPAGTVIDNDPEVDSENEDGDPYATVEPPDGSAHGDETIAQVYDVSLSTADPTSHTGDPSDEITLTFTVTNDGNGNDDFNLTSTGSPVSWVFYIDANSNGIADAGEEVTNTGTLAQNGTVDIIAVGTIPAGTADGTVDNTTFTATSTNDTDTPAASGTLAETVTVTAPDLTLTKSVSPTGSQPPGTTLTYTVVVANGGTGVAHTVVVSDAIPTNTSYVSGSMTVDGSSDDDNNTVDGGETADHAYKAASSVIFDFDSMDANGGANDSHTLTFQVTID